VKLKEALLVVDVQNDFCSGGTLAVPAAEEIIPILNKCIRVFSEKHSPIFAARDWHPNKSRHFKKYGGRWPSHCVQDTKGAQFHPDLKLPVETIIISKGMHPAKDSYSAFQAMDSEGRPFFSLLMEEGIKHLFIGGLATDYCVKCSVLDAVKFGFKISVFIDAVKGVDLTPGDSERALGEMKLCGARMVTFPEINI
jgi:nicotinamidase/pyrazinamidase